MKTLPLDILLYIIDLLAGSRDIESLRTLSRACKSMVPFCRKHLFSTLFLGGGLNPVSFNDLLSKNPDIARYVRNLNYEVFYIRSSVHELNILEMLKKSSSLRSIGLSLSRDLGWNDLTESIRSSMLSLIQLPTVTFLSIHTFKEFPATALSGCGNLIDLHLGVVNLAPPEVNQVITRSKIPAPVSLSIYTDTYGLAAFLNSASLHAGGPIVDFSRLQKAVFHVKSRDDIDQVIELIKVTTQLEYIRMIVEQPVWLAGLGETFAINSYRTLKFLDLCIGAEGDDDEHCDPLCGLTRELRFIIENNILEELKLYVEISNDTSFQTESKVWSAFDSVLTKSGAFPMLHRVWVMIQWYLKSIFLMERLKKDKFPGLVESKAVEFNIRWDS